MGLQNLFTPLSRQIELLTRLLAEQEGLGGRHNLGTLLHSAIQHYPRFKTSSSLAVCITPLGRISDIFGR